MVRVFKESAEQGEPVNDLPQLFADLGVVQLLRRRQGDDALVMKLFLPCQ
jgi:hypothetical protein